MYKRNYSFKMNIMKEICEIRSCMEILTNDIIYTICSTFNKELQGIWGYYVQTSRTECFVLVQFGLACGYCYHWLGFLHDNEVLFVPGIIYVGIFVVPSGCRRVILRNKTETDFWCAWLFHLKTLVPYDFPLFLLSPCRIIDACWWSTPTCHAAFIRQQ